MDSMSRFKGLFEEAKQPEQSPTKPASKKPAKKKAMPAPAPARTRGTGRRSDPNYIGVFAYVPKAINERVKEQLFKRKDLDFSSLVEDLLSQWLAKNK